jgi:proteasome lid subunit RPN8/RPN11
MMLLLPAILWREIEERTRLALPAEACGFLIGSRRGDETEVLALAPGRNVAADPRAHFVIDALDTLAAEDGARSAGLAIVGVWHSHPRGPLAPSPEDARHAHTPNGVAGSHAGWLTLIAVPDAHAGVQLGCWKHAAHGFDVVTVGQPIAARR